MSREDIRIRTVDGNHNPADALTKHVEGLQVCGHMQIVNEVDIAKLLNQLAETGQPAGNRHVVAGNRFYLVILPFL